MGRLGLFLIRVVVWSTDRLSRQRQGPGDYLMSWAARLGLAAVTVIGSLVDWLAPGTSRPNRDRLHIDRAPVAR
jgi:hypothetical protein